MPVLYGAPYLRACLLEFILPWAGAPRASPLAIIPKPTDGDEAADATRDRELAAAPRRVPPFLYDRVAIRIRAEPVLRLLDLSDIAGCERLSVDDTVFGALRFDGFSNSIAARFCPRIARWRTRSSAPCCEIPCSTTSMDSTS